jgi:hypothetical protein
MRGADVTQESVFSYLTLTDYVPEAHPLRAIREIVNEALRGMDKTFAAMYADSGRDSIPPEQFARVDPAVALRAAQRATALRAVQSRGSSFCGRQQAADLHGDA